LDPNFQNELLKRELHVVSIFGKDD